MLWKDLAYKRVSTFTQKSYMRWTEEQENHNLAIQNTYKSSHGKVIQLGILTVNKRLGSALIQN